MEKSIYLLVTAFFLSFTIGAASTKTDSVPVPTQAQLTWQEAEVVAVFHYDLHVFDGEKYVQRINRVHPIEDHNIFNPERLDTDQWIRAVRAMGTKIAILTATHETGFALYQSDVNPYCLKALRWRDGKGDIVKEFVNSCRKYDILPGIYIGIRWNSFYGVHDFKVAGDDPLAINRQQRYNKMCEGMVEELCSRYGDLAIVWFDGGAHGPRQGGPDVQSIFERYQPNGLFYHNLDRADMRWGGSESGTVPYPCWGTYATASWFGNRGDDQDFRPLKYGDPEGSYYCPAMSDAPLRGYNGRHEWFWEPGDEGHIYPLENLMHMYYHSVGHNSSLILGITPDPIGLVPAEDASRMKEFGDEVRRRFSTPLAETQGRGNELMIELPTSETINHFVIQEDISEGERVRAFRIEGYVNGDWVPLYRGSCIGHKHIVRTSDVDTDEVRLIIDQSKGEPVIRKFALFSVD